MARNKTPDMQRAYVQARLEGKSPSEAKAVSGYNSHTRQIEAPGSPCAKMLWEALDKAGLTEDFLALELKRGIEESRSGPRETRDYSAHSKYLYTLSTLKGYGRGPLVAIQNNYVGDPESDPARDRELASKVENLLALLETEAGRRGLDGVHEGGAGAANPPAHPQVE